MKTVRQWRTERRQERNAELAAAIAVAIVKSQEKRTSTTWMVDGKPVAVHMDGNPVRQIDRLTRQLSKQGRR